jgi:hypothetical protein
VDVVATGPKVELRMHGEVEMAPAPPALVQSGKCRGHPPQFQFQVQPLGLPTREVGGGWNGDESRGGLEVPGASVPRKVRATTAR